MLGTRLYGHERSCIDNLSLAAPQDDLIAPVCAPLPSPFSVTLSQLAGPDQGDQLFLPPGPAFYHPPLPPVHVERQRSVPRLSRDGRSPSPHSPKRRRAGWLGRGL